MTDKELRRLKRAELLEILYYLRKEVDDLKTENDSLKARIDELTAVSPIGGASGTDNTELLDNIRKIVNECLQNSGSPNRNNTPKKKGRK